MHFTTVEFVSFQWFARIVSIRYSLSMPGQTNLVERCTVRLPVRTAQELRESKAEDPAAHGLDPEVYFAVVTECELGAGGLINANGRIYPTARFISENVALNSRIAGGEFNPCESGHPDGGPTLNIAARLISVRLEGPSGAVVSEDTEAAPVSVLAKGDIAFLRTSEGQNLYTLYRAGFPLGTSAVNRGIPTPHTIDENSPHLAANPDASGVTIDIIEQQHAIRYDIVHTPSASTFIPTAEARDAYESLCESVTLPPLGAPEPENNTEQEPPMEITLEAVKNCPEIVKALTEAAIKSNPLLAQVEGLGEGGADKVQALLTALGTDAGKSEASLVEQVTSGLKVQMETEIAKLRVQMTAQTKAIQESLNAERAESKKLREAAAVAAKTAANGAAFKTALEAVHSKVRPLIEARMTDQVAAFSTPEAVTESVKQLADFAKTVSEATAKPATPDDADADTGADAGDAAEQQESKPVTAAPIFEALLGTTPGKGLSEAMGR